MKTMAASQWQDFVLQKPRTAKLATVKASGSPHVAPVWVDIDDDGLLMFNTGRNTQKGRAIRRDPRVCLCFDDEAPPFSYLIIEGAAATTEDPGELLRSATRIAARYMGDELAEQYGRRNAVPGEMLVKVTPTKVIGKIGIAD